MNNSYSVSVKRDNNSATPASCFELVFLTSELLLLVCNNGRNSSNDNNVNSSWICVLIYMHKCSCHMQAVEDFHAQIGSVASTLLDEFRLAFQYAIELIKRLKVKKVLHVYGC